MASGIRQPDHERIQSPRSLDAWQLWWAALPATLIVSPLSLLALSSFSQFPPTSLLLLGFYTVTQALPAFFSPTPLAACLLALVRCLLMAGLLALGAHLKDETQVAGLKWGLLLVYVQALIASVLKHVPLFTERLWHPVLTSNSLGLAGAAGLWLAAFLPGHYWSRILLALFGGVILILSGSRGGMVAATIGLLLGAMVNWWKQPEKPHRRAHFPLALTLLLGVGLVAGGAWKLRHSSSEVLGRFTSTSLTGREAVWEDTVHVIASAPLTGVGTYLLGTRLSMPINAAPCGNNSSPVLKTCPTWLTSLQNPWLIAHNLNLQALAETGPLGLMGLLLLTGAALSTALARRQTLSVAVMGGLLVASATDNTILIPSPFFGELYWVLCGMQLLHLQRLGLRTGLTGASIGLVCAAPLASGLLSREQAAPAQLLMLSAPEQVTERELREYPVAAQFALTAGNYEADLYSCRPACKRIDRQPFRVVNKVSDMVYFKTALYNLPSQQLRLLVRQADGKFRLNSLGAVQWEVKRLATSK